LHPYEPGWWDLFFCLHLQAQRYRFLDPLHQLIEGTSLGVAAMQFRHSSDKVLFFILLDDDCEFSLNC
jgi:hypothetical protein